MEEQGQAGGWSEVREGECVEGGGDAKLIGPYRPMRERENFILRVMRRWWIVLVRAGMGRGKK